MTALQHRTIIGYLMESSKEYLQLQQSCLWVVVRLYMYVLPRICVWKGWRCESRSREEFHVVIVGRVLQFEEQTSAFLVGSGLNKYAWGPGGWCSPWLPPAGQDISTSNMCFCCFNVMLCVSAVVTCFQTAF